MPLAEVERRRLRELMLRAASSFEEGVSGVNISFLVDNEIQFDESKLLHDAIAFAIRSWVSETWPEG